MKTGNSNDSIATSDIERPGRPIWGEKKLICLWRKASRENEKKTNKRCYIKSNLGMAGHGALKDA